PPSGGGLQQGVVWRSAPKEKRQARGEFQIRDSMGSTHNGIILDAADKLRTCQNAFQRGFDSRLESSRFLSVLIIRHHQAYVFFSFRPPVSSPYQGRNDLSGARCFRRWRGRMTCEDPTATGSIARAGRIVWTGDR